MESYIIEVPCYNDRRVDKIIEKYGWNFLLKNLLTVVINPCYYIHELREEMIIMPNMPRCDIRQVIFRLEIETAVQLQKYAAKQGRTVSEIIREIVHNMVKDVELTAQDYLEIAAEVARNEAKRNKS